MDYWNRIKQGFNFIKRKPMSLPDFDLGKIKLYFNSSNIKQSYQVLTEQTCTDLNLDDFFVRINKTYSCVGQQYLYDRLRRVPLEPEITENDNIIQYLKKNMESTDRLQKLLSKLAHKNACYIC